MAHGCPLPASHHLVQTRAARKLNFHILPFTSGVTSDFALKFSFVSKACLPRMTWIRDFAVFFSHYPCRFQSPHSSFRQLAVKGGLYVIDVSFYILAALRKICPRDTQLSEIHGITPVSSRSSHFETCDGCSVLHKGGKLTTTAACARHTPSASQ